MDLDFKSKIEDESVSGLQSLALVLCLGLAALFVLPSLFLIILMIFFPKVNADLLSYYAMFLGYGSYLIVLGFILGKEKVYKIFKGFNFNNLIVAGIFAVIVYLASILASSLVSILFGNVSSNANQDSLNQGMIDFPLVVILLTVIFAPVVEELVFRFSIYRPLAKKNRILAYIVSVVSFAGVHFISSLSELMVNLEELQEAQQAYSMFFDDLKTLPIYMAGAFVLTLSYDVNKNIATNIMIHAFYNFIQVLLMLLMIRMANQAGQVNFECLDLSVLRSVLLL